MSKNVMETQGPQMTSQYGAYALHAGLAWLQALTRMHTLTRPQARMQTQAYTHWPVSNTYCFSMATMIRERASLLRNI
jgi:hypothetical protein